MSAQELFWERVQECLDRGLDPREQEGVLELLLEHPRLAAELADLMDEVERLQHETIRPVRVSRRAPFAAALLAAAALLFALVTLRPRELASDGAQPAIGQLLSFHAEFTTAGPRGTREITFEYTDGRLRERSRLVERTLPPSGDAGELRTALIVETLRH